MAKSGNCAEVPLESFSNVVEAVYDCALDPHHWHDTVRMIAELLDSQRCVIGVHDCASGRSELAYRLGYDNDAYWQSHESKFRGMNPFFAPLQLMPVGTVTTRAMLLDDEEFLESRFYQEWCKPQNLGDAINVKVLQTGQRMGLLVANRLESRPRYADTEIHLLTLLSPHVCRSIAISDVLNLKTVRSEALEATLDALTCGVYLLDGQGRIVHMNCAAEYQVKRGGALRVENNRLIPVDRLAQAALSRVIAEAMANEAETPSGGITLALPAGEDAGLVATVLSLARGDRRNLGGGLAAMAAIFVQDPIVVPRFPGEAFAKLYGLTGAELRVVLAMAPGLGAKEAAEMLGISETTAKTHLQHVYAKTNTAKQTELIHLFMSSTPPVGTA